MPPKTGPRQLSVFESRFPGEENAHTRAWNTYAGIGVLRKPETIRPEVLKNTNAMLTPNRNPASQLMRGWVNVELMFAMGTEDIADEDPEALLPREAARVRAEEAFDLSGRQAWEDGDYGFYVQSRIAAVACDVYETLSRGRYISDEEHQVYLTKTAQLGEELLGWAGYDFTPDNAERVQHAKEEVALQLALNGTRGDSRKPVKYLALPATYRQRHSRNGGGREKVNWHITTQKYNGNWDTGHWHRASKLFLQPLTSTEKHDPEVRVVDPAIALAGSRHRNVGDIALGILLRDNLSEADRLERQAIVKSARRMGIPK